MYYVKQNGKGDFFFYQQMEQEQKTDQGTGRDLAMIIKALRRAAIIPVHWIWITVNLRKFMNI